MKKPPPPKPHPEPAATASIRIGRNVTLDAQITTRGLLSVGALVSGILLSSAIIVLAARKHRLALGEENPRQISG